MAKDLGNLMKLGAHAHPVFFLVQLALSCNTLALEKKQEQTSTRKRSGQLKSDSNGNKRVELFPVFEIGNSALN